MGAQASHRVDCMRFNNRITIDGRVISMDDPAYIIGEAGVNHNGDPVVAMQLVDIACAAGVNAVKFQRFNTDRLVLKDIEKAPYQRQTTDANQSQYDMLKDLELRDEDFREIMNYCKRKGVTFLCTPFDEDSLCQLDSLGVSAFKIAATDLTNVQFLRKVAERGKPIILSAGMCYLDEVRIALETLYPINRDVILLQCTANYPLDDAEVNLNVIDTLKKEFDIVVGYSDHSRGIGASPYAVAKGAKVIEKHFTIDKKMKGPDHNASVSADELCGLVKEIRHVEEYLGSRTKIPTYSEQFTRKSLQKCFVSRKTIKKGEKFTDDSIIAKRTNGQGISALYYDVLLNQLAERDYAEGEII